VLVFSRVFLETKPCNVTSKLIWGIIIKKVKTIVEKDSATSVNKFKNEVNSTNTTDKNPKNDKHQLIKSTA